MKSKIIDSHLKYRTDKIINILKDDSIIMEIRNIATEKLLSGNFMENRDYRYIGKNQYLTHTYNISNINNGVSIKELNELDKSDEKIVSNLMSQIKHLDMTDLINRSCFGNGIFIHVQKNIKAQHIIELSLKGKREAIDWIVIYLEKGASATIREKFVDQNLLYRNALTLVKVEKQAKLNYAYHQDINCDAILYDKKIFFIEDEGVINGSFSNFGCKYVYHKHKSVIKNCGISNIDNLFFQSGKQNYRVDSQNIYKGENGGGEIEIRGVCSEKSEARIDGKIHITKQGKGTETFLAEKILMLNDDCSVTAIPNLEIDINDVKARHSVSVATIKDENMFYLLSRGISMKEAKKMMASGFLVNYNKNLQMKEMILKSISQKLTKIDV